MLWLFTGTPEFFDTRHGVAGLTPLHDRIRFLKQGAPPPSGKLSPVLLTTRGLQEMSNASLQRGCQS